MKNKSPLRIYLASSWRNEFYPNVLTLLRSAGHEVYDFRNPAPGNHGFAWSEIDENWPDWTPYKFIDALKHPIAKHGYSFDKAALDWCNVLVLLLPCGRSAHLEAGYAIGQGKPVVIFIPTGCQFEPELMYKLAHKTVSAQEPLIEALHDIAVDIDFKIAGVELERLRLLFRKEENKRIGESNKAHTYKQAAQHLARQVVALHKDRFLNVSTPEQVLDNTIANLPVGRLG